MDDLRLLTDFMTVELLYLQSRQAIMKVSGRGGGRGHKMRDVMDFLSLFPSGRHLF